MPVEFTFDIFRMTKGEQNRGVDVTFRFVTHNARSSRRDPNRRGEWQWDDSVEARTEQEYKERGRRNFRTQSGSTRSRCDARRRGRPGPRSNELAEKFGFFEIRGKEVFDYPVMGVEVPAGLFRNALQGDPGRQGPRTASRSRCRG